MLGSAGIKLTITAAKRHEKVGRAEHMISKVKRILLSVVKTYCFKDYYDLQHKISLIQLMLNERPTFLHGGHILTPHSIDSALMRRSSSHIKVFTLSDFIIPKDKTMRQLVHELTLESKEVLNLIAGEMAAILLNKKVQDEKFAKN